ncbi:hypothetical protein F4824DRAFT_467332 [Ustulina deusta]|nr:hypothetical protein F4824DRAFT_467332 [Ustulina deusta]
MRLPWLMPLETIGRMTASKFRTWFWKSFKIDISLLDLLGPKFSLAALAEAVESGSNE